MNPPRDPTPEPPRPPAGSTITGTSTGKGEEWLWLVLALGVGLVRFLRLGEWSLWYDEAITLADGQHALAARELHNPLGYRAVRWTVEILGGVADEASLRFLPALVGFLVVPLTWWALRPLVLRADGSGGARAALAALLVAASPWHVYWSQNARFYTLAQAAALVGSALVARALFPCALVPRVLVPRVAERDASSAPGAGLGGATLLTLAGAALLGLGAVLHLSAGILAAALFVASLTRLRSPRGRRVVLVFGLLAVGGLVPGAGWVLDAWNTYHLNKATQFEPGAALSSLAHFVLTTGFWITPLIGTASLVGAFLALRARDEVHVFATLVVTVAVAGAALAAGFVRVSAQYVFVLLPWVALLAARPMDATWMRTLGARVGYALVLALPTLAGTALYMTVQKGQRPRWREAYQYVGDHAAEGDLILGMQAPVGEYYLDPGRTDLRDPRRVAWLDKHRATGQDLWRPYERRIWWVLRPEDLEDWDSADKAALLRTLTSEARLVRRYPLAADGRDLSLEVWRSD